MDKELPTGDGVVQIAYLHGEHVSHSWHDSIRRVMDFDARLDIPTLKIDSDLDAQTAEELAEHFKAASGSNRVMLLPQGMEVESHGLGRRIADKPLNIKCGSGVLIPTLRNYATRLFLDKTDHEWLLFIDTDMGFEDDAVHRLLASADPIERPIMGALCFAVMVTGRDRAGGWRQTIVPTMYALGNVQTTGKPSFCFWGTYEQDTVTRVGATGGAFLLLHRSVLNLMRDKVGDHWWDMVYDDTGEIVGEDITFCLRANSMQIPVHVNTGVRTTHHKETWISEDDYLAVSGVDRRELDSHPEIPVFIDLQASFAALERNDHDRNDMLKFGTDLDRYEQIIAATKPDLIIETGTFRGGSARWFAKRGVDVVSIDVNSPEPPGLEQSHDSGRIVFVRGSSIDPAIIHRIRQNLAETYERVMVVLDSDHSAKHVAREIELYGPLVTPGCYLVVEDTIFGYGTSKLVDQHFPGGLEGSPLDAVAELLHENPEWSRDVAIEGLSSVSSNPAGWWVRNG
jgi:cephalosporin hydroxylase